MGDDLDPAERAVVRSADSPWTILRHDAWPVVKATWADAGTDNLSLIAAGTAFWGFAAIVPLLAATVLTYGLIATPVTVAENIKGLFGVLPRDAAHLIADQLSNVVTTSGNKKGWGLFLALLLAVYGGTQGASALVTALNVAYEERETRGVVKLYLVAFAITGTAVILALGAAASTTATAFLNGLLPGAPDIVLTAIRVASYAVLGLLAVTAAGAALPLRTRPRGGEVDLADARIADRDFAVAGRNRRVRLLRGESHQLQRDLRIAECGDRAAILAVAVRLCLPARGRAELAARTPHREGHDDGPSRAAGAAWGRGRQRGRQRRPLPRSPRPAACGGCCGFALIARPASGTLGQRSRISGAGEDGRCTRVIMPSRSPTGRR